MNARAHKQQAPQQEHQQQQDQPGSSSLDAEQIITDYQARKASDRPIAKSLRRAYEQVLARQKSQLAANPSSDGA